MMKRNFKNFGYTYLEILMGLMIVGVLSGLGLMMYPGVQRLARDNQRRSDLKQYQTSLEALARKNQGFYPSRNAETHASDMSGGGTPNLCASWLGLSQCPADPKYGQSICRGAMCNYYFWSNGGGGITATRYVLYARLEKQVNDQDVRFIVCSNGASGVKKTSGSGRWDPSSTCPW